MSHEEDLRDKQENSPAKVTPVFIDKYSLANAVKNKLDEIGFISFFDLCAGNITMPFRNIELMFLQTPDIRDACGENARVRHVTESLKETCIGTVCQPIKNEDDIICDIEYYPVRLTGVRDSSREETKIRRTKNIPDLISRNGIMIELIPTRNLMDKRTPFGDISRNIIQIPESESKSQLQYNRAALSACIDLHLMNKFSSKEILSGQEHLAIQYIIMRYFDVLPINIQNILFRRWLKEDSAQLSKTLEDIFMVSFEIIQCIESPILSFDETAFVNATLDEDVIQDYPTFLLEIQNAVEGTENEEAIIDLTSNLAEKFETAAPSAIDLLLDKKESNDGFVYTYPPFRLSRRT